MSSTQSGTDTAAVPFRLQVTILRVETSTEPRAFIRASPGASTPTLAAVTSALCS